MEFNGRIMEITEQQRLMMIGAMTLCRHHYTKVRELEKLMIDFVGEENEDWVTDVIYGDESFNFDTVIEKCKITIV